MAQETIQGSSGDNWRINIATNLQTQFEVEGTSASATNA